MYLEQLVNIVWDLELARIVVSCMIFKLVWALGGPPNLVRGGNCYRVAGFHKQGWGWFPFGMIWRKAPTQHSPSFRVLQRASSYPGSQISIPQPSQTSQPSVPDRAKPVGQLSGAPTLPTTHHLNHTLSMHTLHPYIKQTSKHTIPQFGSEVQIGLGDNKTFLQNLAGPRPTGGNPAGQTHVYVVWVT